VRADVARADRYAAVRAAAEGWRHAGAIDEGTHRAIVAAYPDDRARLGLGFRVLAGLAAFVGGGAFAALAGSSLFARGENGTLFALGFTLVFAIATEIQIGRLRRAQAGAEYATAMLAANFAVMAWCSLFSNVTVDKGAIGAAVVLALVAWRWGYALFAAGVAVCLLVTCAQTGVGRAAWVALGVAALPLTLGLARSGRWPPAHRRCFEAAALVFLAGAYVAANVYSLDHRWIEGLGDGGRAVPGAWARGTAILGTALLPPVVLYLGVRVREHGLLAAGALFTAASLVTLRQYHPVGPWWLSLVLAGAACLVLAVALRRWLESGPGRERLGLTADPLFEERRMVEMAQAAATIVAMSPGPRPTPEGQFEGGGGRSGGGGATGGC
jgi:hypothetical protein